MAILRGEGVDQKVASKLYDQVTDGLSAQIREALKTLKGSIGSASFCLNAPEGGKLAPNRETLEAAMAMFMREAEANGLMHQPHWRGSMELDFVEVGPLMLISEEEMRALLAEARERARALRDRVTDPSRPNKFGRQTAVSRRDETRVPGRRFTLSQLRSFLAEDL
ncbi:hypothetical protein ACFL6C_04100 [Myxococcota bacterium]